jgi:pantoate--beta-alanine ligase
MAKIVRTKEEIRRLTAEARAAGKQIGLVPTMGALHVGHRRLLERAAAENDVTVVSVFVNPTQFGPAEDYNQYPRQLESDAAMAGSAGVDFVFAPSAEEMYDPDFSSWVDEEALTEGMCGARRPGHFRGVATVCTKLFNIVQPHRVYLGQKDFQQLKVIERIVRDFDIPVEVCSVPTVRGSDGLAMSSRNQYLSDDERQAGLAIWRALKQGAAMIHDGERSPRNISEAVRSEIVRDGVLRIDYVEVNCAVTLEPVIPLEGQIVIAVAVYCDQTRLIDNILVDCPDAT